MKIKRIYKIKSTVWIYPGLSGWHFINIPKKESEEIIKSFGKMQRGWGSLPVMVSVGKSTWKTSIFKDKKSNTYLLPLKASIRKEEGIFNRDIIRLKIEIIL